MNRHKPTVQQDDNRGPNYKSSTNVKVYFIHRNYFEDVLASLLKNDQQDKQYLNNYKLQSP